MWNKQRKDELLIDVDDVALGHETRMRWNAPDDWVWSTDVVHEPLVDTETFEQAQQLLAAKGAGRRTRERHRTRHPYVLRGLLLCGVCDRRMQGQWNHDEAYYRCRFPQEYALANTIDHPRNVYLAERDVLPRLDDWLAQAFAPTRLEPMINQLYEAQDNRPGMSNDADIDAVIADCDDKLARYRQALEAGAAPALVAIWTVDVQARKAEALARERSRRQQQRMTRAEIEALVDALGNIHTVLSAADPHDQAEVYRRLNLRLAYQPAERLVRAETTLHPGAWGSGECPRGDLNPHPLAGTSTSS